VRLVTHWWQMPVAPLDTQLHSVIDRALGPLVGNSLIHATLPLAMALVVTDYNGRLRSFRRMQLETSEYHRWHNESCCSAVDIYCVVCRRRKPSGPKQERQRRRNAKSGTPGLYSRN
jgi:hypothetical protein